MVSTRKESVTESQEIRINTVPREHVKVNPPPFLFSYSNLACYICVLDAKETGLQVHSWTGVRINIHI